jgi:RNA polymerase II subunit A-like phosphatase
MLVNAIGDLLTRQDSFFPGTDDINAIFLPPRPDAPSTTPPAPSSSDASSPAEAEPASEEDGLLLHKKVLDDISQARPLAKLKEQLEHDAGSPDEAGDTSQDIEGEDGAVQSDTTAEDQQAPAELVKRRKPLLNNIDNELDRLSHVSFFMLGNYR